MEKFEDILDKLVKKLSFVTDKLEIVSDKIFKMTGKKIDVTFLLIGIVVIFLLFLIGIKVAGAAFSSVASGEVYNQ